VFIQTCTLAPRKVAGRRRLGLLLEHVVVEELLNQINMGQQHAPAAEPPHAERRQRLAFAVSGLQEIQILLPLVAGDLAAREAADRNDHGCLNVLCENPFSLS